MSYSVGTLLSICIHFSCIFKVFINIDLIKIDNSYIFPLGKTVMHRLELSIMFATLGQLAAAILNYSLK